MSRKDILSVGTVLLDHYKAYRIGFVGARTEQVIQISSGLRSSDSRRHLVPALLPIVVILAHKQLQFRSLDDRT